MNISDDEGCINIGSLSRREFGPWIRGWWRFHIFGKPHRRHAWYNWRSQACYRSSNGVWSNRIDCPSSQCENQGDHQCYIGFSQSQNVVIKLLYSDAISAYLAHIYLQAWCVDTSSLYANVYISNEDPFCIMSLTTWILSNDDLASNVTSLFYVKT